MSTASALPGKGRAAPDRGAPVTPGGGASLSVVLTARVTEVVDIKSFWAQIGTGMGIIMSFVVDILE